MDKLLSIEEADKLSYEFSSETTRAHYRQFADTMRENERLWDEVREYEEDMAKLVAMTQQK